MKAALIIRPYIICWNMLMLFIVSYVVFDMLGVDSVSSICFAGTYMALVIYTFWGLKKKSIKKAELLILIIIAFISMFNVFWGESNLSFNYSRKIIFYLATLLMLIVSQKYVPNESNIKWFICLTQIIAVVILYKTFFGIEYYGTTKYMSLGLENSNTAGMWVFLAFVTILWQFEFASKWYWKVFLLSEMVLLCCSCVFTGCRSVLVSLLGLVILYLLFNRTRFFDKVYIYGAVLIPVIFPIIYISLYNRGFNITFFQGKSLYSGRQTMWSEAFAFLAEHPIRGGYYELSNGTGMFQMHNIFVDVAASYGIIVVILTWVVLLMVLLKIQKKITTREQHVILFSFLLIIAGGSFEAAFFSGGAGIGIMSCSLLALINYKWNKVENNEKSSDK